VSGVVVLTKTFTTKSGTVVAKRVSIFVQLRVSLVNLKVDDLMRTKFLTNRFDSQRLNPPINQFDFQRAKVEN